jgi:hypothetical protein
VAGKPRTAAKETAPEPDEKPDVTPDPELSVEEYMTHRQEVLDRLPPEEERPKNIYGRLAQINGLIGLIRKTGVNKFHKYTYAKESDLVEEIRPMLAEYGIWIEQGLATSDDGANIVTHERRAQYKQRDNVTVESLTIITKKFRFVWWSPERNPDEAVPTGTLQTTEWVYWMGYGDDTGDKGYYKAETGAVKYFLMKTFMVATGNDPEADAQVDERAARRDAGPVEVRSTGRRPAAPGGRQQQTSSPQRRQIGELLRAQGITSSVDAIKKLEEVTGDTIPVADPEDINGALAAYLDSLQGDKAGEIVQKLRPAETDKPTEDETATPDPDAKGWSDAPGPGDDADDGSIDSTIA